MTAIHSMTFYSHLLFAGEEAAAGAARSGLHASAGATQGQALHTFSRSRAAAFGLCVYIHSQHHPQHLITPQVKGKAEPVRVYSCTQARDPPLHLTMHHYDT